MASDLGAVHNPFSPLSSPAEAPTAVESARYPTPRPRWPVPQTPSPSTPLGAAAASLSPTGRPAGGTRRPPSVDVVDDELTSDDLPSAPLAFAGVEVFLCLPRTAGPASASPAGDAAAAVGPRICGIVSATAYAFTFSPAPGSGIPPAARHFPRGWFSVPVQMVAGLDVRKPMQPSPSPSGGGGSSGGDTPVTAAAALLEVSCKDVRSLVFGFSDVAAAEDVAARLRLLAFPRRQEAQFLAFSRPPPSPLILGADPLPQPGWLVYEPLAELRRVGAISATALSGGDSGSAGGPWRVTVANSAWALCPSYPAVLAVPAACPDAVVEAAAKFRARARIPALTWRHPVTGATLWRSAQPLIGVLGAASAADEALLRAILAGAGSGGSAGGAAQPLLVADCRPFVNAVANRAGGGGTERYSFCAVEHLGLANIHALREAHRRLAALAAAGPQPGGGTASLLDWLGALGACEWTQQVRLALAGAALCAEALHRRGQSVLVHCSDGWDRTAQVASLTQLLLDPFFRTTRGLCVLIAKEWCAFGHQFAARAAHGVERRPDEGGEAAPICLLFLDAVAQLARLFPASFEFTPLLPLFIAHHVLTCRFGTFLGDCERERTLGGFPYRTPSLWGYILEHRADWASAAYVAAVSAGGLASPDVLLPHPALLVGGVVLWREWFLRYSSVPCISWPPGRASRTGVTAGGEADDGCYPVGSYDRAALDAARQGVS